MKQVVLWLVIVGLTVALVAPVGAQGANALRVGLPSTPRSFDPLVTTDGFSTMTLDLILPKLIRYNNRLEPIPYLAKSWKTSPDRATYTFVLDERARWTDGTPVTAADVKFSIQLWGNRRIGSVVAGRVSLIQGMQEFGEGRASDVSGVQVVDDHTIKISLLRPSATFLNDIYYYVLPAHILGKTPPADLDRHPYFQAPTVGAGPYKFVAYRTGQAVELERNTDFFLGSPKIERVVLRFGPPETLTGELERGELDIAPVIPTEAPRMARISQIQLVTMPFTTLYMHVNTRKPYLRDQRVRQAIAYALDRERMARVLYAGFSKVANGPFESPPWAVNPSLKPYKYSPDTAKRLLAEAGWDSSNELLLRVATGNVPRERAAPLVQAFLQKVGIRVRIITSDFATLLRDLREGSYDLGFLGWGLGIDPDQAALIFDSRNGPPGGWDIMGYANSKVDQLFDLGRTTVVAARRQRYYYELQAMLNDELPVVFMYTEPLIAGVNRRVQGVQPVPFYLWGYFNNVLWNVYELSLR